jgi:hypothetical protein
LAFTKTVEPVVDYRGLCTALHVTDIPFTQSPPGVKLAVME